MIGRGSWIRMSVAASLLWAPAISGSAQGAPATASVEAPVGHEFKSGIISGYVVFPSSFDAHSQQRISVYIESPQDAPFLCMSYADFRFTLTGKRNIVTSSLGRGADPKSMPGGPDYPYIIVPPRADPSKPPKCIYPPRSEGRWEFYLDALYPNLEPGVYQLQINFSPRDHSIQPTLLGNFQIRIS
jgi:hypothetical protein